MFDKNWFTRFQKPLLWFANTLIGKWVFCLKTSSVGKNKIIKIEPNSITWKEGKYFKTEFRTHDKFGKRLFYAFKPLWYLLHLWDMAWYPKFNLGFDTLTAYPSAGSSSPVDGWVYRGPQNETFSNIRTGAGENADNTTVNGNFLLLRATTTSNQYQYLTRAVFMFDTSSLTSSAVISSAVLSIYGTGKTNALGSAEVDIVSVSTAGTDALVAADYAVANWGTTVFSSVTYANFSDSAYNDITLDSNGIANVSKTSISKFGARLNWDTDNSFGGSWSSAADTRFNCYMADQTGTSNDPKLVVTYTVPGGHIFISS